MNLFFASKSEFMNLSDLKKGNANDDLVKHNLESNHIFNFEYPKMLIYIHYKKIPENY